MVISKIERFACLAQLASLAFYGLISSCLDVYYLIEIVSVGSTFSWSDKSVPIVESSSLDCRTAKIKSWRYLYSGAVAMFTCDEESETGFSSMIVRDLELEVQDGLGR